MPRRICLTIRCSSLRSGCSPRDGNRTQGETDSARNDLTLDLGPRSILGMGQMRTSLKIGELAGRCGVSRDTIRFYERRGLLPRPRRTPSLYRLYSDQDASRLLFI